MDTGTVNDISQNIAYFYGNFFYMSNRRWKMRGLKFTDLKRGTLDLAFMEKAFADCKDAPMPSRLVTFYLIYAQVCTIKRMMFGEKSRGTHLFNGIHAQEIYDRLTFKSLGFHKRVLNSNGSFKSTFTMNPATCIINMTTRCIKDVLYDLYRFDFESSKGKKNAWPRSLDMRVKMMNATSYCCTRDLEAWMDTIGMDPFEGVPPCQ